MPYQPSAYDAYQLKRWMRHDAHLWMQPNPARFLAPGTDPADVYPALARQRDQANAAFAAKIEEGYRLIATLREEVASIRADMARRRALAIKYSPAQPRVPAGNPRGGQWTGGSEGGTGFGGLGGFGSADGEGSAEGTGGEEDVGNSGNSESGGASGNQSSPDRSEGEGTRGYDDRLAGSDQPSPGRTAMLGIMARAAERAIEAYRSGNLLFDLFGNKSGAIAATTIDDKDIFGSNSSSSTYTPQDRQDAMAMRDTLMEKYPDAMKTADLGQTPSNGLFHAETNVLLRAARQSGGTLAGRSLDVYIDRDMCLNCRSVVPLVGLELGNPDLTFVDPKWITTIHNGSVSSRSKR